MVNVYIIYEVIHLKNRIRFRFFIVALICIITLSACSNSNASDTSKNTDSNSYVNSSEASEQIDQESIIKENSRLILEQSKLQERVSKLEKENSEILVENSQYKKLEEESKKAEEESKKAKEESKLAEAAKTKTISIGETVSGNGFDFTLKNVGFTYEAMPENPPTYYSYYEAKAGKIYIKIDANIKNTSKVSLNCDEIYSVTADYNNGYTYTGFAVADDHDGDFTYASITRIDPLETLGIHYLIECPDEVSNNTSSPLVLIISLDGGTQFKYTIR